MQIEVVGLPDIDRRWALVAEDISRCLRKAEMEIGAGDIWANCRSGQWLLILAHDGERVHGTTVWRFTVNRFFECVLLVGTKMKTWAPALIDAAIMIGKAHDCRGLCATGLPPLIREIQKTLPRAKVVRHTFASEFK